MENTGFSLRISHINRMVPRFIITVLVGTVLHAVACIVIPPFEFAPTRLACFFWALRSGIVVFPILFAVLLLPLRTALRRFMPQSTPRTHAIVAALVLYVLPAARTLARQLSGVPAEPFEHGYLCQWIFWAVFAFAIALSFFWPFGAPTPIQAHSSHDLEV
jgi:hypothetical protein